MYIGEIIKKYRIEKNISQRTFASRTSLSASYINTLEKIFNPKTNKPYSVTTDAAAELAKAMNISIDELLKMLDENQEFISNENTNTLSQPAIVFVYGTIPAGIPMEMIEDPIGTEEISADMLKGGKQYFRSQNKR